jgi:histone-lysine N-methyltransferase ASH1L
MWTAISPDEFFNDLYVLFQPCKCGSVHCRGVIGGKSQRVNGTTPRVEEKERRMVGRPRKNARKNSASVGSSMSVSTSSSSSGSSSSTGNNSSSVHNSNNNSSNNNLSSNASNSGSNNGSTTNSSCTSGKLKYKKALNEGNAGQRQSYVTPVKPMSHQQRCFAQLHHCFLLRNLEKVRFSLILYFSILLHCIVQ